MARRNYRKLTADVKTKIQELVDILEHLLPLKTYQGSGVTFTSIFAESGIRNYLVGSNKSKALYHAWEKVFQKHLKLPYILIRKIILAAIDYRRYKRDPLHREELDELSRILFQLGFDMRKELSAIQLDESIPEIKVPPSVLTERLRAHPICTDVSGEPVELFANGHFNESVRKACERFEKAVQDRSGMQGNGTKLVAKVFNPSGPILRLNDGATENEKNIQEGYMHLTMGMMSAIRNVFSHGDETQRSPEEAFEMLLFLNWLFRFLPESSR